LEVEMVEGTLHVDGCDLHYTDEGRGDPVVLIPPAGSDSTTWGDFRTELLRDHRVIAYDRRGYGRSAFEGAPTLAVHAQDVGALIEHLDAAPAVVVGISVGATIALELAIARPDLVRTAMLYEIPFHAKRSADFAAARTFMRVAKLAKRGATEEAAAFFLRWAYRYPDGGTAFDLMPAAWQEVAKNNAPALLNDLRIATAEGTIPTRAVRAVSVPAVCLVGEKSHRPMHGFIRRVTRAIPNSARVELPGAAHAGHFDQPYAFAAEVHKASAGRKRSRA
jgi:pimeloyl-ACP methyl ester carboxylesterase